MTEELKKIVHDHAVKFDGFYEEWKMHRVDSRQAFEHNRETRDLWKAAGQALIDIRDNLIEKAANPKVRLLELFAFTILGILVLVMVFKSSIKELEISKEGLKIQTYDEK